MSINRLVSIDNVIVNLMDDLALDHTKFRPMFTNWAVLAEKKIGSFYSYKKKHAVLDIKGCTAELPCDAVYLQIALLGDFGCDCSDLFNRFCSFAGSVNVQAGNIDSVSFLVVDLPAGWTSESGNYGYGYLDNQVQGNQIIFRRNLNRQKVTIQYIGLETDINGIPLVGENHLEAIGEFCLYKFHRRRVKSGIDIGVYRDHKNEFERLVACARGDDAELNETQQENIVSMLHDPFIGRGLKLVPNQGYAGYGYYGGAY